ncbi:MAG: transcriptional repressor [Clostridia bacterium]|nr:transcriptional repressor [Clostridia bacterium]
MEINKILSDAGLKCTKQRISVMGVLSNAVSPLTAEDIFDNVDDMSLSTVYRIVERLYEKGIVNKNTIQDSDKFYYELSVNGHRHYAICLECKSMKYIDICPVHTANIDNFTVTGHKLEIYGYCDKCRAKLK